MFGYGSIRHVQGNQSPFKINYRYPEHASHRRNPPRNSASFGAMQAQPRRIRSRHPEPTRQDQV
jgi:hypothetical protein